MFTEKQLRAAAGELDSRWLNTHRDSPSRPLLYAASEILEALANAVHENPEPAKETGDE